MPYTFFPDAPGGTEIYVAELIAAMRGHGVQGMVAAPGPVDEEYEHNGIAVYRFARDAQERLAYAYGEPDESAAGAFRRIVQKLRPDIVHMHAHTAAVSERVADVAHECGARVVFTYHSPTVSCLRGTMMFEDAPCDGVLNVARCTVCSLQKNGVPPALGNIEAGKLRAVAVASPKRFSLLPNTPTFDETGLPGFEAVLHYGLLAPAGTPPEIVEKLSAELRKLADDKDVQQRIHMEGGDPMTSTAAEYAADIATEEKKWGGLVRKLNLKVD